MENIINIISNKRNYYQIRVTEASEQIFFPNSCTDLEWRLLQPQLTFCIVHHELLLWVKYCLGCMKVNLWKLFSIIDLYCNSMFHELEIMTFQITTHLLNCRILHSSKQENRIMSILWSFTFKWKISFELKKERKRKLEFANYINFCPFHILWSLVKVVRNTYDGLNCPHLTNDGRLDSSCLVSYKVVFIRSKNNSRQD